MAKGAAFQGFLPKLSAVVLTGPEPKTRLKFPGRFAIFMQAVHGFVKEARLARRLEE